MGNDAAPQVKGEAITLWWVTSMARLDKARRILTPRKLLYLLGSHNFLFVADEGLALAGQTIYDQPPQLIKGWRNDFQPCVVIFVGLQQTHWSGLPAAITIARVMGIDTILMPTPPGGNNLTVAETVESYGWLSKALNGRPFYVYAFSKGGFDALWLISATKLVQQCRHFFGISVPFRGTRMAEVIDGPAAKELLPDSSQVLATQVLLCELHDQGLAVTLGGGIIDIVCPRSNCRPSNTDNYCPPPWWKIAWPRLTHFLRGKWYSPPGEPWYWCRTMVQVGHTALYNLFIAIHVALDALRAERRRN